MIDKTFIKNFISNADHYYTTLTAIFFRSLPLHIFVQLYIFKKMYLYGSNKMNENIDKKDVVKLWKILDRAPYTTDDIKNFTKISKNIIQIMYKYGLKYHMKFINPKDLEFTLIPNATARRYKKMNSVIFNGIKWHKNFRKIDQINITNLIHPCYYHKYFNPSSNFQNDEDVITVTNKYRDLYYNDIINDERVNYVYTMCKEAFIYKSILDSYLKNNCSLNYGELFHNKIKKEHIPTLSYALTRIEYKLFRRLSFTFSTIAGLNILAKGFDFNYSKELFIEKVWNIDEAFSKTLRTEVGVDKFIKKYNKLNKKCDNVINTELFNLFYDFYMNYINSYDRNVKYERKKNPLMLQLK